MANRIYADKDWIRCNQERYLCSGAPSIAADAVQHVLMARSALMLGEDEIARFMYKGASELWLQMEQLEPGEWTQEIAHTGIEMRRILAIPSNTIPYYC